MNTLVITILCALIILALIFFPLIVSRKAEKQAHKSEWDKIKAFGDKINKRKK